MGQHGRFWKRDRSLGELEDELQAHRSDPPDALLRTVADRVRGGRRGLPLGFRLSPVYGVALVAVVALIAAGGAGLVSSGTSGAAHVIGRLASSTSPTTTTSGTSGQNQYQNECGTTPPYGAKCVITIQSAQGQEPKSGCVNLGFLVSLAEPPGPGQTVTVSYKTQDGTGSSGATTADHDYVYTAGSITFTSSTSTKYTVNVPICHDIGTTYEYFTVLLYGNTTTNSTIGGTNPATGTIKQ